MSGTLHYTIEHCAYYKYSFCMAVNWSSNTNKQLNPATTRYQEVIDLIYGGKKISKMKCNVKRSILLTHIWMHLKLNYMRNKLNSYPTDWSVNLSEEVCLILLILSTFKTNPDSDFSLFLKRGLWLMNWEKSFKCWSNGKS